MKKQVKFAHLADLHLGGWREKKLTWLNFETFKESISKVIENEVDFCLFAGDIFNNALPSIELVNKVAGELLRLKEANIPLYVIGGSHDYSLQGNSMIHLLETTGVLKDVGKWREVGDGEVELEYTFDENTSTLLAGILGKKKGLDKNIYKNLKELQEKNCDFSIFLFHTTLNDFKPSFLKHLTVKTDTSLLPLGFDYYAGGHVHAHLEGKYENASISYPGPLFPNNFSEMKRETPSFNICLFDKESKELSIEREFINTYSTEYVEVELDGESPSKAREKIDEKIDGINIENKILLLEIRGLVDGRTSEIGLGELVKNLYDKGAWHVLKNTYKLSNLSLQRPEVQVENEENIEEEVISQYLGDENKENIEDFSTMRSLLSLQLDKKEDEKVSDYENRVKETIEKVLNTSSSLHNQ